MNTKPEPDASFRDALEKLRNYIEKEKFKGYDPYDTLNSPFPFRIFSNWFAVIATQIQKRNPVNIRPVLGIKKEYNPKGIGLLLQAYVKLQSLFPEKDFSEQTDFLFRWLESNADRKFSGVSWGYNFGWASPEKYLPPFAPTVVASGFIAQALNAYYLQSGNEKAKDLLLRISPFIVKDIPVTFFGKGVCFSYSPYMKDCCYNASLLAAETLARIYSHTGEIRLKELAISAAEYVVSMQHEDGHWKYKIDPETGVERHQVDFHQGYILDSIQAIMEFTGHAPAHWKQARMKGLSFYHEKQFMKDGRSLWRIPAAYPVEIHNQSQGIITFSRSAGEFLPGLDFAGTIASWTISGMQDKQEGYFYYRKLRYYTNKLSFMRWSNAWMLLALTELLAARKNRLSSTYA